MKRETINKANEIENQIVYYEKLAFICSFPFQKFRLSGKKAYICMTDDMSYVTLQDEELSNLIRDYCNQKKSELLAELDAL